MEDELARKLKRISLLVFVLGGTACTALLGKNQEGDALGEGDRASAAATEAIAEDIALRDALLRDEDPELFAVAKKYFPSDDPGGPGQRFYRLTRRQLDLSAAHLLPGQSTVSARSSLPRDPLIRNYELANDLGFSPVNFTPYVSWVGNMVERVRAAPATVVDCSGAEDRAACQESQVRSFVNIAFRGLASAELQQRYVDFYAASVASVGSADASADLVDSVLNSPHFSFREEVFVDETDRLWQAQALQNLTYTLADVPPGALGFDVSVPDKYLGTPEALEESIQEILASPEARQKLVRFFIAWLEVSEAEHFDISPDIFPEFTLEMASAMVEGAESFLTSQLEGVAPTLKKVTESNETFVSSALADIYGLDEDSTDAVVHLDENERHGIFTSPAFIASHSGPNETRLVKRGAYFTRKVMCQPLGDPPADAIPTGPIPGNTERERIENITEPASCAGCHSYINPFGFMLESYDPLGRYRTENHEGFVIDASVETDMLDEGPIATETAPEALREFTSSAMFRQCFVRQLFTFYTGRRLSKSDDPTLREIFFRFSVQDNQEILGALTLMALSHNFNRRLEEK